MRQCDKKKLQHAPKLNISDYYCHADNWSGSEPRVNQRQLSQETTRPAITVMRNAVVLPPKLTSSQNQFESPMYVLKIHLGAYSKERSSYELQQSLSGFCDPIVFLTLTLINDLFYCTCSTKQEKMLPFNEDCYCKILLHFPVVRGVGMLDA